MKVLWAHSLQLVIVLVLCVILPVQGSCWVPPDENGHVEIPPGTTTIDRQAFYQCFELTSVTIPSSVTTIDFMAFAQCTQLETVTIPTSVTTIGVLAFTLCAKLRSVVFETPSSLSSIGGSSFESVTSLASIVIPSSVTYIGPGAFYKSFALQSVAFEAPAQVKTLSANIFQETRLVSFTVPPSVTSIGDAAFWTCVTLSSITFPTTLISIGSSAFFGCSGLTNISIPKSVTFIGDGAFNSCYYLNAAAIASSWTSIANRTSLPGRNIFTCDKLSPCSCAIGYGASVAGDALTCSKCLGSTYTTIPGRSYCLTVAPSALPTNAPTSLPTTSLPTSAKPSAVPTTAPTSLPTKLPTPVPTHSVMSSQSVNASSNSVVGGSDGLPTYSIPRTSFRQLGYLTKKWYLSVAIYGTGWGTNNPSATITLRTKSGHETLQARCDPGNQCTINFTYDGSPPTLCVSNYEIDSSDLLTDASGSIEIHVTTSNVQSTICRFDGYSVYVLSTLTGSNPQPTRLPTVSPTVHPSAFLLGTGGQLTSTESLNEVVTSTGALFYVIVAVAILFAVLALFLAQTKQNKRHIFEPGLLESISTMSLVGSSLASELFLLVAMLFTPGCTVLSCVVIFGRLLHAPSAGYLLYEMFGLKSSMGSFLDQSLVLESSKIFGVAAVLGTLDVTVLRLFPWLSSPFIRNAGYPTARMFFICVTIKLIQSVVTVSCQISYFVIVNAQVTANTIKAQQSLAFLIINIATTTLLIIINAFEFMMRRGMLLSGSLSQVPDVSAQTHPSLPTPSHKWSLHLARSFTSRLSSSTRDEIPEPVQSPLRARFSAEMTPISSSQRKGQKSDDSGVETRLHIVEEQMTDIKEQLADIKQQMTALVAYIQPEAMNRGCVNFNDTD